MRRITRKIRGIRPVRVFRVTGLKNDCTESTHEPNPFHREDHKESEEPLEDLEGLHEES
jgi:hypothetical protein